MHRAMMTCAGREGKDHAMLISGPKRAVRFLDSTPMKRTYALWVGRPHERSVPSSAWMGACKSL
jgi:hypothetical protein